MALSSKQKQAHNVAHFNTASPCVERAGMFLPFLVSGAFPRVFTAKWLNTLAQVEDWLQRGSPSLGLSSTKAAAYPRSFTHAPGYAESVIQMNRPSYRMSGWQTIGRNTTVRSVVAKSYLRTSKTWPSSAYIQVFNLFYLSDMQAKRALRAKQLLTHLKCKKESTSTPWLWYAWG